MLLTDSIKQSIYEIDVFLEGSILGTLIIEDGQAFLQLSNGEYQSLDDSYQIEIITDDGNHFITYQEVINRLTAEGWPLFAGFQAKVKKVKSEGEETLPDINSMNTIEAISWYTKKVAEITSVKHRVAGTYSEAYKQALLRWKQELNKRILAERTSC